MENTLLSTSTALIPMPIKSDNVTVNSEAETKVDKKKEESKSTVEFEIMVVPWKPDMNRLFDKYQTEKAFPDNRGRIGLYIIEKAMQDKEYYQMSLQTHKTLDRCYKNITDRAKKMAEKFTFAIVDDSIVYGWVDDYIRLDDKADIEAEEKKKAEAKKKAEEAKKKTTKTATKRGRKKKEEAKVDETKTETTKEVKTDDVKAEEVKAEEVKTDEAVEVKTETAEETVSETEVTTDAEVTVKTETVAETPSETAETEEAAAEMAVTADAEVTVEAETETVTAQETRNTEEKNDTEPDYQMTINDFGQMSFIF